MVHLNEKFQNYLYIIYFFLSKFKQIKLFYLIISNFESISQNTSTGKHADSWAEADSDCPPSCTSCGYLQVQ